MKFEIIVEETPEKETLISLKRIDGKILKLNSFLPKDYHFKSGSEYRTNLSSKEINFPPEQLKYSDSILFLLHEIGHSHEKLKLFTEWEFTKALNWAIWQSVLFKKSTDDFLLTWLVTEKAEAKAKSERDAWAFALRKSRQLKKEGYDVLAGFQNMKEIKMCIFYCLATYEQRRQRDLFTTNGVSTFEKYKPVFIKLKINSPFW